MVAVVVASQAWDIAVGSSVVAVTRHAVGDIAEEVMVVKAVGLPEAVAEGVAVMNMVTPTENKKRMVTEGKPSRKLESNMQILYPVAQIE